MSYRHNFVVLFYLQVRYIITTNGTFGIDNIQVQFIFDDITESDLPLTQKFSVTYRSVSRRIKS